jgi:hypothetical protein
MEIQGAARCRASAEHGHDEQGCPANLAGSGPRRGPGGRDRAGAPLRVCAPAGRPSSAARPAATPSPSTPRTSASRSSCTSLSAWPRAPMTSTRPSRCSSSWRLLASSPRKGSNTVYFCTSAQGLRFPRDPQCAAPAVPPDTGGRNAVTEALQRRPRPHGRLPAAPRARHYIAYWGARGLTSLPLNGTPGPAHAVAHPLIGEKGIPAPASSTSLFQASGR